MRIARLEEIAESIVDGPFGSNLKTSDYVEMGIPVLQGKNITGDDFAWKEIRYVSQDKAKELYRSSVIVGDHLLIKIGSIGYSAILDNLNGHEFAIIPANLARIRPNRDVVDDRYLHQWLKSEEAKSYFKGVASKTAQPALSLSKIRAAKIPLPPVEEQKRIAAILDQADSLRRLRRRAIDRLNTLGQAIFYEMFGDPGANPRGFSVRVLSDFYINDRDGTKCGPFGSALKKTELVDSGIPVWNMDNIDPSGQMVPPFRMWITEAKYRELESYSVLDGDVIISRAGTVGKMCVAKSGPKASIISTNLIRVRFGPDLLPIYFVSLMTYCKGRVGRLKTGPDGAFTHMSTGVLDKLPFPHPPLSLQRRFAKIVESIERQRIRLRAHLAELDILFVSLQHRAFRGEL